VYASVAVRALSAGRPVPGGLSPVLIPVDRILQRWAVSIGSGLPTDVWDDSRVARPPPLDDDSAIILDRIVLHAPRRERRVIVLWYRTPAPTAVIAKRLNLGKTSLKLELHAAQFYVRAHIIACGSGQLRRMLLLERD